MMLEHKIEALLFYRGNPIKTEELRKILKAEHGEVETALNSLEESLSMRGIRLMRANESVMLATAPDLGGFIEDVAKEELSRDLGKAGLETLSIILYMGPITRSRIDWVRGVNSSFIVRNLLVRGLIERVSNPDDARTYLYRPTFDLLSHLGVARVEDLPDYTDHRARLKTLEYGAGKQEGTPREEGGDPSSEDKNDSPGTEAEKDIN